MKGITFIFRRWAFLLWVLSAVFLSLLWPGDASWTDNDQLTVIDQALQANASHRLSFYYRGGSTAAADHPFMIWVYQFFFSVTHDLIKIIFIKQFIVIGICLAGLCWLSRELNYNKYLILIYFSSLPLYNLSRTQLDDSLLVPFSLLLFVFFAWFYRHKGYGSLICLTACAIVVIHINHRGLITVAPFVVAFLFFENNWLKKHWRGLMVVFGCAVLVCTPYFLSIIHNFYVRESYPLPERAAPVSFLFTIVSGGLWYSYDFFQLIPDMHFARYGVPTAIARIVISITMAGYIFLIFGMVLTVSGLGKRISQGEEFTLEDRIGIISMLTILLYIFLLYVFQLFNHWIYHSGLWFCSFYFIWRAVTSIQRRKLIKYVFPIYLATMIFFWIGSLVAIHNSDRIFTIKKATDIAGKISAYSPESDIVQLVEWDDECEELTDLVIENSDNAALGFYYRDYGLSLKSACRALRSLNINLFYNALKPLVYIQRQGRSEFLPARTLVIKNDDSPGKRGIILVDDPEQVCIELNKMRLGGQLGYF